MKKVIFAPLMSAFLALTACGGGGSDTGGGGGSQTFSGTESLSLRARGTSIEEVSNEPLTVSVGGGMVVITNVDQSMFRGAVGADNRYTATGSALAGDIGGGVVCEPLVLTYTGAISGNTSSGSVSGFAKCSSILGEVVIDVSGTFSASL